MLNPHRQELTFYDPNSQHQEKSDILYPNSRQNIRKYFKKGEMWVKGDTHKVGCSPSWVYPYDMLSGLNLLYTLWQSLGFLFSWKDSQKLEHLVNFILYTHNSTTI